MSNKTRLQTNNTNLQALINKANALPDAGSSGGGNAEIVIGTVTEIGPLGVEGCIYYTDGNHMFQQSSSAGNISVLKNSIIYISNGGSGISTSGLTRIAFVQEGNVYHVTQDFTVKC
jgi:hypothetical protein